MSFLGLYALELTMCICCSRGTVACSQNSTILNITMFWFCHQSRYCAWRYMCAHGRTVYMNIRIYLSVIRVYPHDGLNPSVPWQTAHHVTPRHGFVLCVPRPRTSWTENAKLFFALGFARTNTADLAESAIVGLATSAAFFFSFGFNLKLTLPQRWKHKILRYLC